MQRFKTGLQIIVINIAYLKILTVVLRWLGTLAYPAGRDNNASDAKQPDSERKAYATTKGKQQQDGNHSACY